MSAIKSLALGRPDKERRFQSVEATANLISPERHECKWLSLGVCRSRTARNTELMVLTAVARPFGGTNHHLGDRLRSKSC